MLGVTSDTLPLTLVDAYAQNILLQKLSQISGVGLVGIGGRAAAGRPRPGGSECDGGIAASASTMCRAARRGERRFPTGTLNSTRLPSLHANDQLIKPDQYANRSSPIATASPVRIRDIGRAISGRE